MMMEKLKKTMLRKSSAMMLAAVLLAAVVSVPSALAYFTDYARASGSKDVKLEWQTELREEIKDNDKHITVSNVGDTPVAVRVRVFANQDLATVSGSSWQQGGDGWYYYKSILRAGQTTDELLVDVKGAEELPDRDFNIAVVHESQRVVYETNDTLAAPDGWDAGAVAAVSVQ